MPSTVLDASPTAAVRAGRGRPARTDCTPVGARLKTALRAARHTNTTLAEHAGVHRSFVSGVIRGHCRITPELAVAAERLLGIDAADLIRLDNEQILAKRLTRVVELRHKGLANV